MNRRRRRQQRHRREAHARNIARYGQKTALIIRQIDLRLSRSSKFTEPGSYIWRADCEGKLTTGEILNAIDVMRTWRRRFIDRIRDAVKRAEDSVLNRPNALCALYTKP